MTAVVLAGRSSSAFAAEIGTMKVNEEISALKTMGLQPVHFLVAPRIVAAVAMTPVLTVFANLAGILGGLLVFVSMGYSPVSFYNQMLIAANIEDILSGLVKAFFFGILVAGVGCLRGLQTRSGASAVGDSTTRAVVSSIILIAVADGAFSIVYYALGI
jgi:phospholipid/cholesterol/gamma-HCH transport system permease protein